MSETQGDDGIVNEDEKELEVYQDEEVPGEGRQDWSGCPNCGGKMDMRFETKSPRIEGEMSIWAHVWRCNHCWTTVDRTVRVPHG